MSEQEKTLAGKAAALKRLNARRIRTTAVAVASVLGVPVVLLQLLNLSCNTLGIFCMVKPGTEHVAVAPPVTPPTTPSNATLAPDAAALTPPTSSSGSSNFHPAPAIETKSPRPVAEPHIATAAPATTTPKPASMPSKAWLGIRAEPVTHKLAQDLFMDAPQGALVTYVEADGPASLAGIQQGDVIIMLDGHTVDSDDALQRMLQNMSAAEPASLEIIRKGLHSFLTVNFAAGANASMDTNLY